MHGTNFNTVKDPNSGSDMVTTSIDLFVLPLITLIVSFLRLPNYFTVEHDLRPGL